MKYKNQILTETAITVSLSLILSLISIFKMPNGGSVSLASAAPIIIFSFRRGCARGLICGFVYSIFQIITGFHLPPSKTLYSLIAVILLDYVVSYTCLGFSAIFKKFLKNKYLSVVCGAIFVFMIRLLCSTLSGALVWKDYFPENTSIWIYSLIYNLSYLIPECVITLPVCLAAMKKLNKVC